MMMNQFLNDNRNANDNNSNQRNNKQNQNVDKIDNNAYNQQQNGQVNQKENTENGLDPNFVRHNDNMVKEWQNQMREHNENFNPESGGDLYNVETGNYVDDE